MVGGGKVAKLRRLEARVNARTEDEPPRLTNPQRFATEVSISGHGLTQSSQALAQAAHPLSSPIPLKHPQSSQPSSPNADPSQPSHLQEPMLVDSEKKSSPDASPGPVPSQTTSLVNEFGEWIPQLTGLLIEAEIRTAGLLDTCACSRGKKTVTCLDCVQYPLACEACFVEAHKHQPLHWAERWSSDLGCFVRHDISALSPLFAVHLGHSGDHCPWSIGEEGDKVIEITLIALNGIHRTRVRFCNCGGIPDRVKQLMMAGFFPASIKRPRTAFAFNVLNEFQRLQLVCKASAYDYCHTLRRATDDVLTSKTPDIFPQFTIAMQAWRVMQERRRLGQEHGIDRILRHRRPGNLIVHCPVCPEPHVNIDEGWREIPELLRHLCQLQLTGDGNHQANRFLKNTDPLSESLFAGAGHFPTAQELDEHLHPTEDITEGEEKSTCTHLNAAEKQDRKKFKNMDITGVVNVQCSHVYVKSTVDLQLGERFTNMDLAYGLSLGLYRSLDISSILLQYITSRDLIFSYDIACGYLRKLVERFRKSKSLSHLVGTVARTRGIIPAVHIQNHQDNCMYMYWGAYTPNSGHFHGETAEQDWVESNQLGPQTRQMNTGQRHDVFIAHANDWGFEKTKRMPETLPTEVTHAKELYQQHKLRLESLCVLHADMLPEWNKLDRTERKTHGKDVECVYRHSPGKVPSQKAILDALLNKDSRPSATGVQSDELSDAEVVHEGISIQNAQHDLSRKITLCRAHSTVTSEKEVEQDSKRLRKRIDAWRREQRRVMPMVSSDILSQASEDPGVSSERLFLPSDYNTSRRTKLDLDTLGSIESQLREGLAFDAITSIQQYVKCIEALKIDKRVNAVGQDQNTRPNTQITQVVSDRQAWIDHYNSNRDALISLGLESNARSFPPLTLADTYRPSTNAKRALGDSQRFDGSLWASRSRPSTRASMSAPSGYVPTPIAGDISTQGAQKAYKSLATKKRKEGDSGVNSDSPGAKKSSSTFSDASKVVKLEDGWIWRLGTIGKLTAKEIEAWEKEGDRVHWFRAEAEMERWREQWEIKLIEFIRCIKSFTTMADTWSQLADEGDVGSKTVYARQQTAVYRQLCFEVESSFAIIQADEPTEYQRGEDIVEYIIRHRKTEVGTFHPQYNVQLFRVFS